ncbi:MAG: hypothetical protein U1E03_09245 [Hyphomonadaceae bacterium]
MSGRQIRMLFIAVSFPAALGALVVLGISAMAAALVPVDAAGILRLWPIFLLIAGPSFLIFLWWLIGNWRE